MSSLRFLGKTAIVTGAGGAIGRSYALELARRGASVVVNDVGSSLDGSGASDAAGAVVREILAMGGKAVANTDSVLQGDKIVAQAVDAFGSCDVLINNAGILRDRSMAKMSKADWRAVLDVHLEGSFSLCHAAWPLMQSQHFGRIVNVGSGAGLYGNFGQANYSAAKMGILGLTNTLALEGQKYNITANCVVPVAGSRMTETVLPAELLKLLDPAHITPIVTYLAHESCATTGGVFEVGGGWFSQVRLQRSGGVAIGGARAEGVGAGVASAEELAARWAEVGDFDRHTYPSSAADALRDMMIAQDIAKSGIAPTSSTPTSTPTSTSTATQALPLFPSDKLFEKLQAMIANEPDKVTLMAAKLKARVAFEVTSSSGGKSTKRWVLHLKPGEQPAVFQTAMGGAGGLSELPAPNVTLQLSDASLLDLASGNLSPEYAYMRGLLKVQGQMGVALKVKNILLEIA